MKTRARLILLTSFTLFLLLIPLVGHINFYQNDDWVYYEMVLRFMQGDFTLHPYTGPTFILQGIIAAGFAKLFGIARLPILTLILGVANFYIFTRFINEKLKKPLLLSLLLGLLLFFNPLNIYSLLGFMTEQYFMFFMLCALWFYKSDRRVLFSISVFLGLLVRQVALFIPMGLAIYTLYNRQYKKFILLGLSSAIFYYYYQNIFPLTERMAELPLLWERLLDFDYSYSLIFGLLIVITAYLLPIFLGAINVSKRFLVGSLIALILYFGSMYFFNPHEISWGEFPYFENTFERTGFYPRGVGGTKYHFKGSYDLFKYWDIGAKLILVTFIGFALVGKKRIFNEYIFLAMVYVGMLILTDTFYDRYVLFLLPIAILYLTDLHLKDTWRLRLSLASFVLFLMWLSYQFANDFIVINNYVWNRAEELAKVEGISKSQIQGTNAWKLNYRNKQRNYLYNFTFDSSLVNKDYAEQYTLVEEKDVEFFGSLFVDPKVFLYKKK